MKVYLNGSFVSPEEATISPDDRGFLLDPDLSNSETELTLGYGHALLDGNLALGGGFVAEDQPQAR